MAATKAGAQGWIGWGLLALAVIVGAVLLRGTWAIDLTALYFAGHFFETGRPDLVYLPGHAPFVTDPPAEYLALNRAEGGAEGYLTPYLYPPLWAALLAPLTAKLSAAQFMWGVQVVNLLALAASIRLSFLMARPGPGSAPGLDWGGWVALSILLVAGSWIGVFGLLLGQPQILVGGLILLAFHFLIERRDIGAGAVLALAAAMKLSPALLVLVFVMERRWRALAAFALAGIALLAASLLLAGAPLHAEFLERLAAMDAHVLVARTSAGVEMLFYQLGALAAGTASWNFELIEMPPEPGWITWTVRALLLLGLALAWRLPRGLDARRRIWVRLFATYLLILLANPLPWNHYLLVAFVMLPGLTLFWPARPVLWLMLGTWLVFSPPVFRFAIDRPPLDVALWASNLAAALGLFALALALSARAAPDRAPDGDISVRELP